MSRNLQDQDAPEKNINKMGPDMKTPEQLEEYAKLREHFNTQIRPTLEEVFGKDFPGLTGKIAGNYQLNGGKLDIALETEISKLQLPPEEKEELKNKILTLIDQNKRIPNHHEKLNIKEVKTSQ